MVSDENPNAATNSAIVAARRRSGVSQVKLRAWSQERAPLAPAAAAITHPAHMAWKVTAVPGEPGGLIAAVFAGAVEHDFVFVDAHRDSATEFLDRGLELGVGERDDGAAVVADEVVVMSVAAQRAKQSSRAGRDGPRALPVSDKVSHATRGRDTFARANAGLDWVGDGGLANRQSRDWASAVGMGCDNNPLDLG